MVKQFAIALVAFVVLDGLWLGVVARDFYRRNLSAIARVADGGLAPIWPVAAMVYPVMALGLTVFVLGRAGSAREAMQFGALFGFVVFAVYDLTNHSVLRDWRTEMTVIDIAWGSLSHAAAAWITYVAST